MLNADSTQFVTEQAILAELNSLGIKPVGKAMSDIDATAIEQALRRSEYLEQAQCVKGTEGRVIITVSQLVPVMRVFDGENSYYVNRDGKRMTAVANYHADVPVVRGHFTKAFPATRLLPLVNYVEQDSALHALVTMYQVRDSNNIFIVPAISGHVVNMGNVTGFESKFKKLHKFYTQVMPAKGWLYYDTISVKWKHQVVGTRRAKAVKTVIEYNDDDDEPMADAETMGIDNATPTLATDGKNATPKTDNSKQQ